MRSSLRELDIDGQVVTLQWTLRGDGPELTIAMAGVFSQSPDEAIFFLGARPGNGWSPAVPICLDSVAKKIKMTPEGRATLESAIVESRKDGVLLYVRNLSVWFPELDENDLLTAFRESVAKQIHES